MRQIEIQLGHLCNNRCVFCVSGQLSEQRRAPQLDGDPIAHEMRTARARGAERITFLGGEPTIQRSFPALLRLAVELDFPEIVIFTNGVMTPRESFRIRIAELLADLGPAARQRVLWRFSLQGGDAARHDATTQNSGSWQRILDSMTILREQGARLTANMCVVTQNYQGVAALADLAAKFGLENMHLDMVRPRDAGERSEAELRAMIPDYRQLAVELRALVVACDARLGPDYDINIGNLPYCFAPDLARKIHHDGEPTLTVAASGQGTTQAGFDKYQDKRIDKRKVPACASCLFDARCGGIFAHYGEFYGYEELRPLSAEAMWHHDVRGDLWVLLVGETVTAWIGERGGSVGRIDERAASIDVRLPAAATADSGDGNAITLVLQRAGRGARRGGWALWRWGRIEAEIVGRWPGDGALPALGGALAALDRACGGDGSSEQTPADMARAAATRRAELGRAQARAAEQQRLSASMAAALRGAPPPGLSLRAERRSDDGAWLAMEFADGAGRNLTLELALQPDERGRARPRLRHRAEGMAAAELTAASASIGEALRATLRGGEA